MELRLDWRKYQEIFFRKNRFTHSRTATPTGPVYLLTENDVIIVASAESEDLTDLIGTSYKSLTQQLRHRPVFVLERAKMDEWISKTSNLTSYLDQVLMLKDLAEKEASAGPVLFKNHFLLEAVSSWWSKVLPSSFGIFIRLEGPKAEDILLIYNRGNIIGYGEPDLTGLQSSSGDRSRLPPDVTKHLSEKYLVPIQGLFLSRADWVEFSASATPWRKLARAMKDQRLKLYPFRWGVATLVATRAFLGL